MNSTDPIVAAGRRLAHLMLKDTGYDIDVDFVDVRTRASCNDIARESGFDIRIDRLNGIYAHDLPSVLAARVIHAAAHMLCIQAGVSSHSGSGRHTQAFEQACEALGHPANTEMKLNKSQRAAAEDFAKTLANRERQRPARDRTAYQKTTVVCPAEGCRHTLTLRTSSVKRTRFLCVEHAEEMLEA